MRRVSIFKRLATLAALGVAVAGIACNAVGNEPTESEAVVQGTAVTYIGTKIADNIQAAALFTFAVRDRNQSNLSTSTLNAIEFTTFTATFTSPIVGTSTGTSEGIFYLVGSVGNTLLFELPEVGAGTSDVGHIHFDGHDNLGRHVGWDVDFGVSIVP